MIQVKLVDPDSLPGGIPGFAHQLPGDVLFAMSNDLTAEELVHHINRLGIEITREAIDAAVDRSSAAAEPPLWLRPLPGDVPGTAQDGDEEL